MVVQAEIGTYSLQQFDVIGTDLVCCDHERHVGHLGEEGDHAPGVFERIRRNRVDQEHETEHPL